MDKTYVVNGKVIIRPVNGHTIEEIVMAMKLDYINPPRIEDITDDLVKGIYCYEANQFDMAFDGNRYAFPDNEDYEVDETSMCEYVTREQLIDTFCANSVVEMLLLS